MKEIKVLEVKKISVGTVFKIVAIGLSTLFVIFGVISEIMGVMGFDTGITFNNQPVTGIKAIVLAPLFSLIGALIMTAIFGSMIALGLWIYSFFKPIKIEYEDTK